MQKMILNKKKSEIAILSVAMLIVIGTALATAHQATAQAATTPYPSVIPTKMAPIDQYLMPDQAAEIALARSAAPESIARDAEVLVLGRHGYETAVKGKNGFVCIVGRGWAAAADPDYWNPRVRVPMCVNAAAAHTYLLRVTKITDMALAGRTLAQVNEAMAAAIAKKELPPMEPGAMCYMMSKQGYGGDTAPHWPLPPDVFLFEHCCGNVGSESARLSRHCCGRCRRADDSVRDSSAPVVGRNGRSSGGCGSTWRFSAAS